MTLEAGTRLGHFEVRSPIGAGGMGEVYRARDLDLGRDVALKVLPDAFAADPPRLARFAREARAVAALNHPNIVTVFEVGTEGRPFVATELLTGHTLRSLLGRPIPVARAVDYATQIADGLAAAHAKGIVHRDIKPENLFVTNDGRVKILDFGISMRVEPAGEGMQESTLTAAGGIIGTPGYMAPEQVRGEMVDARADLFALGAVLFEMLTGTRAFHRQTNADTTTAILTIEPPSVADIVPAVPPGLAAVVQRCLAKTCDQRLQSAKDVAFALELAIGGATASLPAPGHGWSRLSVAAVAVVSAAIAGVASARLMTTSVPAARPLSASISFPTSAQLSDDLYVPFAVSPDGALLAYITQTPERLMVRRLDGYEASLIAGTDAAFDPFFSPDSHWVGYWGQGQIRKVPAGGGPSVSVCETRDLMGASWGENGSIVFAGGLGQGLSIVPASGGSPQLLTTLDATRNEMAHAFPQFIDGARAVIFTAAARSKDAPFSIEVVDLATRTRRTIMSGAQYGRYLSSGHLIFVRERKLFAVKFSPGTVTPIGQPTAIVDSVRTGPQGQALFSITTDGTLVYTADETLPESVPVWVDRNGAVRALDLPPRHYAVPRISPNGKAIAVNITDMAESDIWIAATVQPTLQRFTFGRKLLWSWHQLSFSPDGSRLAYTEDTDGGTRLVAQALDGKSPPRELLVSKQRIAPYRWLTAGAGMFVALHGPDMNGDLAVVDTSSNGSPTPLIQQADNQWGPSPSPDGRYVAYVSDETGRFEVYVTPYPGPGARRQLTTDGGTQVVWSLDGKEIFYRHGDRMMAMPAATTPSLVTGRPRVLFEGRFFEGAAGIPEYDVAPDGRFLMLRPTGERPPSELRVVLNWFEELRRRVP